jgi:hypothetical protein
MGHRPLAELTKDMAAAAGQVRVGAKYAHYKHPEQPYTVIGLAILEATDGVAVLYGVEENNEQVTFIRPLDDWLSTVEWNGRTMPRFSPVAG